MTADDIAPRAATRPSISCDGAQAEGLVGLPLSRSLAEAMGAKLTIDSEPGAASALT